MYLRKKHFFMYICLIENLLDKYMRKKNIGLCAFVTMLLVSGNIRAANHTQLRDNSNVTNRAVELKLFIKMSINTDADTGFMHESFHKNNLANFTRAWFTWRNTLFGKFILELVNENKVDLQNSIE